MTTILTRKAWGAQPHKRAGRPHIVTSVGKAVTEAVIHHSVTKPVPFEQVLRSIQEGHLTHPRYDYSDIAYNAAVSIHTPHAAELRGPLIQGGATGASVDAVTLSVCVVGDFENVGQDSPTETMADNLEALLLAWIDQGYLSPDFRLTPHSKHRATACPGSRLAAELPLLEARIRHAAAEPAAPVSEWKGRAVRAEQKLAKIRALTDG